jgi:hypothetical protein
MAVRFDRLLVRPTGMQLISALQEAQDAANATPPALDISHDEWMGAITKARGHREGACEWNAKRYCDASGIAFIWWTDHAGRRHFRVLGHRWPLGGFHPGPDLILRGHPPLWAIAPGQCFLREVSGRREWVVVCACGEVGPAERLGWMGRSCAACHDRTQEGEELMARVRVGLPPPDFADPLLKRRFAVQIGQSLRNVIAHKRAYLPLDSLAERLTYSFLRDDETDEGPVGLHQGGAPLAISDDAASLALGGDELRVFRLRGEAFELDWELPQGEAHWSPSAFSPAGRFLALSNGREVSVRGPAGVPMSVEQPPAQGRWGSMRNLVCFGPDGGWLYQAYHYHLAGDEVLGDDELAAARWAAEGRMLPSCTLHAWRLDGREWKLTSSRGLLPSRGNWFSPCGRWYAWTTDTEGLSLQELATGRPVGRLSAELNARVDQVNFLDGETMLLSQGGKRYFVPWRLLLGLGPAAIQ